MQTNKESTEEGESRKAKLNPLVGSLHCPNCGGDALPDCVRCTWCGSSLASVSCPDCFGVMFVGMKHCPWCGAEASREVLIEKVPGKCPRCQMEMFAIKIGSSRLNECQNCGGLWVRKDTFQEICDDHQEQEAVLGTEESKTVIAPMKISDHDRMYIPCPECGDLMNRVNFAGCSGIVIDWCKEHGSWFDKDELRQIVTFIQRGGLKRSREREKERMQEESRRLHQEELRLAAERNRVSYGESGYSRVWDSDRGAFLDFLSEFWRGLGK